MSAPAALATPVTPEFAPYLDGAAQGRLILPRCAACSRLQFPPRPVCRYCPSTEFDREAVDLLGRIYSWTVTERAPLPALEDELPLTLLVVTLELPDPVRLVGRLDGVSPGEERLRAGAVVVGEFGASVAAQGPVLIWSFESESEVDRA
jgi:hypothetical protein